MDEKLRSARGTIHENSPVENVYVLGSFYRQEQSTDSDIDLLVVFRVAVEHPFDRLQSTKLSNLPQTYTPLP